MTDKDQHKPLFDKLEPPRKRQMFNQKGQKEITDWSKSLRYAFEDLADLIMSWLRGA